MPWEIDVMTVLTVSFREVDESRFALLLYRFSFNIDYWFTTSTRRCNRQVNCCATEMLLATTRFTAKTVPLLRAAVVFATQDFDATSTGSAGSSWTAGHRATAA
jgi:hypothetical protein